MTGDFSKRCSNRSGSRILSTYPAATNGGTYVWFERDYSIQRRDFADRHRAKLFLRQWRIPRSPFVVIHELCRIDPRVGVVINLIIYAELPAIWAADAPNSERRSSGMGVFAEADVS